MTGFPEEALEVAAEAFIEAETANADGLKALCLAYMGLYNVALGRVEEGAEQQDLAAAIALSGKADAVTGALIYCNILWTCRNTADWGRAQQWSAGFETWCSASFAVSTGTCDLHRAEVTGAQESLADALKGINDAIAKLTEEEGWALGDGYRIRGDLQAMIGNLDAARADFEKAYAVGWDGEPGNAVLLAEAGEIDAALAALDRTLSGTTWFHLQRRLWIKAHKAWIAARNERPEIARKTLDDIGTEISDVTGTLPSVHAMVAEAQAQLKNEDEPDRMRLLLLARQLWTAAGFGFHEARLRVEIAVRLQEAGDFHGARCQLDAAEHIARRIGSGRILGLVTGARFAASSDPTAARTQ
ncbi:hypothetical protein EU800_25590 [Tropicimonas sp. IMCC6043]|nr:hypothetical protein EU800_25590 [Tropicimonas sp. IMCC6043]